MEIFTKSVSLILTCVMLVSSLAACSENQPQGSTETNAQTQTQMPIVTDTGTFETQTQETNADTVTDFIIDTNITTTPLPDTNNLIQTVNPWTESIDTSFPTDTVIPDTDAPTDTQSNTEPTQTQTQAPTETSKDTQTSAPETEAPTTTPQTFPKNTFPLLESKKYVIKLTIPDNANTAERLVATEIRKALKSKTSVDITASTDFDKEDKQAYEILIGKTSRNASTAIYNSASFNAYGVKIIGNKIVFFFTTDNEGSELVEQFAKSIRSNDEGQFWVSDTLSLINTVSPKLTSIPKFPEADNKLKTVNCYDDTQMVIVSSTTLAKFNEYCSTLTNTTNKYVEYSRRDNVNGNYFRIYTKGNTAINAYFSNGRGQARIIVGPLKDIPSKDVDKTPKKITPSVTMIGPSESTGNGLALIYQLENGKFLIIDGGYNLSDRVYKELRELQPSGELIITGWFISHPHIDHQESLEVILNNHAREVTIENIYFNYITPSYYDNLTSPDHQGEDQKEGHSVIRLKELLAKKLSLSTKVVKPHTGQIYTFGSATVEIISTIEDFLPTKLDNVNTSSMIVRVNVAGNTTMVLADATKAIKQITLTMYGSYLKSDMVTLAHHGVWVDTPEMYNTVTAKVLLWPSNTAAAKEFYHGTAPSNTSYSKPAIKAALSHATDVFLARGTDTKLNLPYKPVGNKQNFIDTVLNG